MSNAPVNSPHGDKTLPAIRVWVCPQCGYWRSERSTGVHVHFPAGGLGETHELEEAQYIFEGTTGRKGSTDSTR